MSPFYGYSCADCDLQQDKYQPIGEALIKLEKAKKFLSVGDKIRSLEPGQFWLVPNTTNVE